MSRELNRTGMIDKPTDWQETGSRRPESETRSPAVIFCFVAVCILVIGGYVWSAKMSVIQLSAKGLEENYYNLLVQGFRGGQLSLKREVPLGLAQLADPYDPVANDPYRSLEGLHDLSYFQRKLHLYFGVTPALVLFWPHVALTGHYLAYRDGGMIFFSVGFLAGAALLWGLWRRYFAQVRLGVVMPVTLALGLTNFTPAILAWCKAHEVAISCGYALTMVTLLLIWQAMEYGKCRVSGDRTGTADPVPLLPRVTRHPSQAVWWLAAGSLAYGLAVGTRPSLLFGAVILLLPVIRAWREKQRVWPVGLAAVGPILLIGMSIMLYNALRFGGPLEFGQRYQLSGFRQGTMEQFSSGYLWTNLRVGFLAPARWSGRFPFVQEIAVPPLPAGYFEVVDPYGLLVNVPLVGLALILPFTIFDFRFTRRRGWCKGDRRQGARDTKLLSPATRHPSPELKWLVTALVLLFAALALPLLLHNSMCLRYEVEFAGPILLLAVIGILSVELALAGRPALLRVTRCIWGLLLAYSVAFNLLLSVVRHAEGRNILGGDLFRRGRVEEAIIQFQRAVALQPENVRARHNLGLTLARSGRVAEAVEHFACVVRLEPRSAEAHDNLGQALSQLGRREEAAQHLKLAERLKRANER